MCLNFVLLCFCAIYDKPTSVNLNNLINVGTSNLPISATACLVNFQYIRNKTAPFQQYLIDYKIETRLRGDDVIRQSMKPTGFSFLNTPRINRRGGGVGLISKNSIETTFSII